LIPIFAAVNNRSSMGQKRTTDRNHQIPFVEPLGTPCNPLEPLEALGRLQNPSKHVGTPENPGL